MTNTNDLDTNTIFLTINSIDEFNTFAGALNEGSYKGQKLVVKMNIPDGLSPLGIEYPANKLRTHTLDVTGLGGITFVGGDTPGTRDVHANFNFKNTDLYNNPVVVDITAIQMYGVDGRTDQPVISFSRGISLKAKLVKNVLGNSQKAIVGKGNTNEHVLNPTWDLEITEPGEIRGDISVENATVNIGGHSSLKGNIDATRSLLQLGYENYDSPSSIKMDGVPDDISRFDPLTRRKNIWLDLGYVNSYNNVDIRPNNRGSKAEKGTVVLAKGYDRYNLITTLQVTGNGIHFATEDNATVNIAQTQINGKPGPTGEKVDVAMINALTGFPVHLPIIINNADKRRIPIPQVIGSEITR